MRNPTLINHFPPTLFSPNRSPIYEEAHLFSQPASRLGTGNPSLQKGVNRRLECELGAWFEGFCGFALVLALSQMMEHGLGPFGRADLHPRRNPLDRQGRFAPQPGSEGQLVGSAVRSLKSEV